MKKKLLIINGYEQFGYHTDTYNYCLYLYKDFSITFISPYLGLEKIVNEDINIKYIPQIKNRALRFIFKIIYIIFYTIVINPDIIFLKYFTGCSIIKKLFLNKKFVLDIRTSQVVGTLKEIRSYNNKILKESEVFENITIITDEVRELLKIPEDKCNILPLGGKTLIKLEDDLNLDLDKKISLIYVGTFTRRRIIDTVKAFNKLSEKYNGENLEYKLIGFFENDIDEKKLLEEINKNQFNNIKYLGRVKNEELGKYFLESNIGVAFIPITEYFTNQPATKTYEYLFNGLFVIATSTIENQKVVNNKNGILIDDTEEAFYDALEYLYNNKVSFSRREIINTINNNSWENISLELGKYFNNILENNKR